MLTYIILVCDNVGCLSWQADSLALERSITCTEENLARIQRDSAAKGRKAAEKRQEIAELEVEENLTPVGALVTPEEIAELEQKLASWQAEVQFFSSNIEFIKLPTALCLSDSQTAMRWCSRSVSRKDF